MSEPALARAGMSGLMGGVGGVVEYPNGKDCLEATLAIDDFYEVNLFYFLLSVYDAYSVTYNAMLAKAEAVVLLHRTLGHVAVQRIKDLT